MWLSGVMELTSCRCVRDDCWSFPGNVPAWPTAPQIAHVLGTTRKVSFTVQMIGNFPNSNSALERTSPVKWRLKTGMEIIQSNTNTWRNPGLLNSLWIGNEYADGLLSTLCLSLGMVELTFILLWDIEHFFTSLSPNKFFFSRDIPVLTNTRDGISSIRIIPWEEFEGTF